MFGSLIQRNCKIFQIRFYSSKVPVLKEENTIIQLPKYMVSNIPKWRQKLREKRIREQSHIQYKGDLNKPVIRCKDKKLNFYCGQIYSKRKPIPLVSGKWHKGGKINGDYFTIEKRGDNPGLPLNRKITKYNLEEKLLEALKSLGINHPTPIQNSVLEKIDDLNNVAFIAETGCGKTLAFLIPIFNKLLKLKCNEISKDNPPLVNTPKALIITPGMELAYQIGNVAQDIGDICGFKAKAILGGTNLKSLIIDPKFEEVDIAVSTLGTIKTLEQLRIYDLRQLKFIVLDEIDSLLDESFVQTLQKMLVKIIFKCPNPVDGEQNEDGACLIMTGATMPENIEESLSKIIDIENLDIVSTPGINTVQPHITHTFKRISSLEKDEEVLMLLKEYQKEMKPTLCFTNTASCCTWLSRFLEENGVENSLLHGKLDVEARQLNFERFQRGDVNVAVCTDLGSRGLDTLRVQNIINFDTPLNTSDYLHRAGRVGRVGGATNPKVTSLVSRPKEAEMVQKLEKSVRMYHDIENVNANIKKLIRKSQPQFDE